MRSESYLSHTKYLRENCFLIGDEVWSVSCKSWNRNTEQQILKCWDHHGYIQSRILTTYLGGQDNHTNSDNILKRIPVKSKKLNSTMRIIDEWIAISLTFWSCAPRTTQPGDRISPSSSSTSSILICVCGSNDVEPEPKCFSETKFFKKQTKEWLWKWYSP